MPPIVTSASSPDTLAQRGYTIDALASYITRKLGSPVFNVELTRQQILDCIGTALRKYSLWRPQIKVGTVGLQAGKFDYLRGVDLDLGPATVSFVSQNPIPQEIFWGNLIDVTPLFTTGLDQLDAFQRWQKTWMRVSGVKPDWSYDQIEKVLYIHNPLTRYQCGIVAYLPYKDTQPLDLFGADWVMEYAFQLARLELAEVLSKFSGAIPGPVKDLTLDQGKRDKAEAKITELEAKLFAAQISAPMSTD